MIERLIGQDIPETSIFLAVRDQVRQLREVGHSLVPYEQERTLSLLRVDRGSQENDFLVRVFAPEKEVVPGQLLLASDRAAFVRGETTGELVEKGWAKKEDLPQIVMYVERFFG